MNPATKYLIGIIKHATIGFLAVGILTFIIGWFNCISLNFTIITTKNDLTIIVCTIGFLSILLGFILTALSVMVAGVQNTWQTELDNTKKASLNKYRLYLIGTAKILMIFILIYILVFIVLSGLVDTIEYHNLTMYFITWIILSTVQVSYITFDRVFDLYENPF